MTDFCQKDSENRKLLPAGFCDLIGQEAKLNHHAGTVILNNFANFGYELIKTPLVEFENTLQNHQKLNEQSFHVPDISSGKNLVFRNDITIQIARLLNTRLKGKNLPIRLCYLGDILKVANLDLHSDRQITQAGIELIGSNSIAAVKEVLDVTLQSLYTLNLADLTIDFCLPKFLDLLLAELNLSETNGLKEAILEKNISKIKALADKSGEKSDQKFTENLIILALEITDCARIKAALANLPISENLQNRFENLLKVISTITKENSAAKIVINIFSDLEFSYHDEIGFTIFSKGSFYPISRGGKYQINQDLPAVGATIYVNYLRKILLKSDFANKEPRILVASNTSAAQISNLQKNHYITIKSLNSDQNLNSLRLEAKNLDCSKVYLDGKIV